MENKNLSEVKRFGYQRRKQLKKAKREAVKNLAGIETGKQVWSQSVKKEKGGFDSFPSRAEKSGSSDLLVQGHCKPLQTTYLRMR